MDKTVPSIPNRRYATARRRRSSAHQPTIEGVHSDKPTVIQAQHHPDTTEMHRQRRRQSPTAQNSRRHLRAPREQTSARVQGIPSRFLLAHRHEKRRRHRATLRCLPKIRQQTTRSRIRAQDQLSWPFATWDSTWCVHSRNHQRVEGHTC